MERVIKALKCVECYEILESPVLLPCSHSICEKHVRADSKDSLKCGECGVDHQIPSKTGFPKNHALEEIISGCGTGCSNNQALEEIISSKLGSLDFGRAHIQIREHCDKLESLLVKIDCLKSDPMVYIYEEFDKLKNRVHIKTEELKLCVDQKAEQVLDMLKEYQAKCEGLLTDNKKLTEDRLINVDLFRNSVQSKLSLWQSLLNMVKINDNRWNTIQRENEKIIRNLEFSFNSLKKIILLNSDEYQYYDSKVNNFEMILMPETGYFNY